MLNEFYSVLVVAGETVLKIVPISLAMGLVFAVLTHWSACNRGQVWWRKREIVTDVLYWFLIPLMARFVRIGLMVTGAAYIYGIHTGDALMAFFDDGFGPLARLPLWAQAITFLVVSDFLLYWFHRLYHGAAMWKYHAIHHSSTEVDWISAARFHPVNILLGTVLVDAALLLAGISPNVMLWVGPITTASSAFVHANLNWTLGPFKYVIAGPVFHRWHHTMPDQGGNMNFAGTFPIWDILFGTWYMPEGKLPDAYGVDDEHFPEGFGAQLLYPFRQ
ncbi:MAG: sterol desaturase family protein [Proteobacteria bacterium]|nr:sterol desaturase family protein [Pseudomonadota bacterium]